MAFILMWFMHFNWKKKHNQGTLIREFLHRGSSAWLKGGAPHFPLTNPVRAFCWLCLGPIACAACPKSNSCIACLIVSFCHSFVLAKHEQRVPLCLLKVQWLYVVMYILISCTYTHTAPSKAPRTQAIKCQWSRRVLRGNIADQQSDEVCRNSH